MSECTCQPCRFCGGTGSLCQDMVTGSISVHPLDDLFDLIPCDECGGLGYDMCDFCLEQEMFDDEYE